ncbi:heavy-metal-associated domain-containing protein [Crateriforma conspicua]|uniref:Heavy-metal-associated domain protein n=1 Tax=Crateriforma conspicua TaxID=2527996 RepID=A0A5C5XQN7_9PLAN|nr:heavy metal-associated domain-containing protein [Crateriforma conspicua]QDV66131.1 Heavy-metal-associated domain protein [Crateriforma conspicua]TWT65516.1 Heavy-metal-associated domain protein [Crateriforma conspicua]
MRPVLYAVAAVAALGIMIAVANMPPQQEATETAVEAKPAVMTDSGTLTVAVPGMHCEFNCYPKVKKALESVDGVKTVELDAQKEEGILDNRQVVVSYEPGFDVTAAISRLDESGYKDSSVVQ